MDTEGRCQNKVRAGAAMAMMTTAAQRCFATGPWIVPPRAGALTWVNDAAAVGINLENPAFPGRAFSQEMSP